jgi:antirestriction protein ArdC
MSTHEHTSQSRDVYQKVTDAIVNTIKSDERGVFTAASQAQKAADWLSERSGRSGQVAEVAA